MVRMPGLSYEGRVLANLALPSCSDTRSWKQFKLRNWAKYTMEESSVEVQQSRLHYEYNNVIGTGKIRVLTLEPGHYTDPLSGNLLDTKVRYLH